MDIDIGAKRPINGDKVFLVGRPRWPSEPPFLVLYDSMKQRESKRNVRGVDPEQVLQHLGEQYFVSITIPVWGIVWFRRSCIRKVVEMSPRHLQLSSTENIGARVLFTHGPDEDESADFVVRGFSLYGISVAHASDQLAC